MKYSYVCDAKTKKEMLKRFDELLAVVVKENGGTKRSHAKMQLSNVGYFSGYYDNKTRSRVSMWLGAEHPIFGKAAPSAKKARKTTSKH